MTSGSEKRNQANSSATVPRDYGLIDPNRRVLDGHTRPCEECGVVDWQLDQSRGEIACNSCGLVVEENVIDPGAEWTNRDNSQDRSRVGQPTTYTLADKGLNTTIDVKDLNTGSAARHGLNSQSRREWRRRRVIDERSKTRKSRERNLVKANQMIRDRSDLPKSLQEETARLYRRLSGEGFVTGRSIAGVTAACTYLVAREEDLPRQIPEIAESYEIAEKELSRLIRQVSRKLNLHKITSPDKYFDKFISDLQLPPNIHTQVNHLWSKIQPHEDIWQGKKPMGVAAALIYKSASDSGTSRTQADVCSVANISEVTLRGLLKIFEGLLDKLGEVSKQ
ncbi:MAG: transcription initiation factor IIB 3 [Euryarchaeota archaeon]|jgi:transcription initiation factor TFIIB|nr:transcription initiation factor IIB 3 [Euryarchaeota archaeon]